MTDQFVVSPNNFLKHDYEDYLNSVYALCLSSPADYFKIRQVVVKAVKRDAVANIYTVIRDILSEGKVNGNFLIRPASGGTLKPMYPNQLINEEALSASATLDQICENIVNIILPKNINDILSDKLGKAGKSTLV